MLLCDVRLWYCGVCCVKCEVNYRDVYKSCDVEVQKSTTRPQDSGP